MVRILRRPCGRELGCPELELVARRIGVSGKFEYFCVPCVTEIIRTDEIAFSDARSAATATTAP
jgi:hypothetical protein